MDMPGLDSFEPLGGSGAATAWKARQKSLDRVVVVRVLAAGASGGHERGELIERARAVARVKHPNLVQIHDVGESDGAPYVVSEFVTGIPLSEMLRERAPLQQKEAVGIALWVAEALNAAWTQAGLVHGSLRPDNILIEKGGFVRVADLGMAGLDAGAAPSPHYLAPEQAGGGENDAFRTDMYALGAILYHMLTGTAPFHDAGAEEIAGMHVSGSLPHPRELNPSVSFGAGQIVSRLMMKDPAHRYPDWNAAIAAMRKVAAGRILLGRKEDGVSTVLPPSAAGAAPAGDPANGARPRPRIPARVSLVAWAILMAWWAGLALVLLKRPRPDLGKDLAPPPRPPAASVRPAAAAAPAPAPPPAAVAPAPAASGNAVGQVALEAARLLFREDFDGAVSVVDRQGERVAAAGAGDALSVLRRSVAQVGRLYTVLDARFRSKLGQPVSLKHAGNERHVVITKVDGGQVEAALSTGQGMQTVSFAIRELDPAELARWLAEDDAPETHAMRCILYKKAGDRGKAAEQARASGPLAEALAAALQTAP
jgi:hypothetical protein